MDYLVRKRISTNSNTVGVGNTLYDIGSGSSDRFRNIWSQYFKGEATSSFYADLAEKYTVDPNVELPIGTVMEVSAGEYNSEICNTELSDCVIGVISEKPGLLMNDGIKDSAIIGLVGTLPVRVIGEVSKKDILVSAGNGCLRKIKSDNEKIYKVAIAFESNNQTEEKLVNCFVK